ncbi:zinc metalloproteinase-disintegrin-like VAP1 isoform X2 [Hyperolius riggenbachi]|uniref:zinc metalloproteinase-disintegrin-like VAP1 isoform X2 n=1 Tax=Hyperolius riggenbachi TaxID=752182 RepID=UPI0035A2AE84
MLMCTLTLLRLLLPVLGYNPLYKGHNYEVVFPRQLHSIYKRDTQNVYPDQLQYELTLNGSLKVIHIEKNLDLLADNYTESHYKEDGTLVTSHSRHQDYCHYHGYVMHDSSSSVVLSICEGLSGIIQTQDRTFFIEPLRMSDSEEHAVYQAMEMGNHTCHVSNMSSPLKPPTFKALWATDAEKQSLLSDRKYIELYMVADHSMVYKSINIYVALIGIEIWDSKDQIEVVSNVDVLLQRFVVWRLSNLLPRQYHDNAQFLTNVDFQDTVVGYAEMSAMCEQASAAIIQDCVTSAAGVGVIVSHEMGHNLGMGHDNPSCSCGDISCIMFPSASFPFALKFTDCSKNDLKNFIYNRYPDCLLSIPASSQILSPAVCGNRFTESGEQCDCGEPQECTDKCCDPYTCRLRQGFECSEGPCCRNCNFRAAGSVCRPAKDECDIADLCDGMSSTCTKDNFKMNGLPCMNGKGACYKGTCPILSTQCAAIWGRGATAAPDYCFDFNTKGSKMGHCKKEGDKYIACEKQDKQCGLLFCTGGDSFPSISGTVMMQGACKTFVFDGGFVNTGTKCSDTNICFSRKCSGIEDSYKTAGCAEKCPGHSVCDHELQCQCDAGWAPPNCTVYAGAGESLVRLSCLWRWVFLLWLLT